MAKKKSSRIWVIKVGSALFVEGGPLLVKAWMQQLARLIKEHDVSPIWVTSGAIASARSRTQRNWQKLPEKQALSAIGQPILMDAYNLALQSVGLMGSQVLLTYDDMRRTTNRKNLKNTLKTLLEWKIVPILNENDAVATEEIQFGDNDLLSAKVAALLGAECLLILTNVDGLFDRNPTKHKNAQIISHLPSISKKLLADLRKGGASAVGTGGMYSKVRAAAHAHKNGVPTWIMRGDTSDGLIRVARGESLGTYVGRK